MPTCSRGPPGTSSNACGRLPRDLDRCGARPRALLTPVQETTLQTDQLQTTPLAETNGVPVAPIAPPGAMIVFESVTKIYEPDVTALRDVTFVIEKGEFVFVVGASGSGKSTIVRLLLKELEPTRGRIVVGGRDLTRLRRSKVPLLRRNVGCVFQDFKLLPAR